MLRHIRLFVVHVRVQEQINVLIFWSKFRESSSCISYKLVQNVPQIYVST